MRVSFAVLFTLIASVSAQGGSMSECLVACLTEAATGAGCSSVRDYQCICTSDPFVQLSDACLAEKCTPEDVTAAEQLLGACSSIVGTTTPGTSLTETGIPTGSVSESASHSVTGGASPTASNSAVPSVSPPADAALGVVVSVGTWGWAVAAVMGAAAAL